MLRRLRFLAPEERLLHGLLIAAVVVLAGAGLWALRDVPEPAPTEVRGIRTRRPDPAPTTTTVTVPTTTITTVPAPPDGSLARLLLAAVDRADRAGRARARPISRRATIAPTTNGSSPSAPGPDTPSTTTASTTPSTTSTSTTTTTTEPEPTTTTTEPQPPPDPPPG